MKVSVDVLIESEDKKAVDDVSFLSLSVAVVFSAASSDAYELSRRRC